MTTTQSTRVVVQFDDVRRRYTLRCVPCGVVLSIPVLQPGTERFDAEMQHFSRKHRACPTTAA